SVLYRASRFARRYRLQLGAALAVSLALIAGTIVSLLYAREASESAAHSQQSELAAKRSEQEAQQSRAAAQENLERFLRMADGVVLDELEREARDSLGAPRPENLEALQGWIARAESLASRLFGHREMHALLRERAIAESGASGVEEPRLREPADQLLFEGLAKLVQRLELFAGASGTLARVRLRAGWAAAHEEQSLRAQASAWQRCIEELSRDPRFPSFALRPQLGLVPLAADPGSKLQEFAVLATGAVPQRDAAGRLELDPESALVLVLLPGGKFWMGTQAEDPAAPNHDPQAPPGCGPVHEVALEPFFCAKHELTQGQWQRAFLSNPSRFRAGVHPAVPSLDFPVENLSHQDAELALRHLGLALPTEAQWEYAARAGTSTPWSTGEHARSLLEHANLADQAAKRAGAPWPAIRELPELDDGCVLTAIVGSFHPNPFGLHDLHGNVREFCVDLFVDYAGRPTRASDGLRVGEVGKLTGKEATGRAHMYVVRGGCYMDGPSLARSAYREAQLLDAKEGMFGVRAVRAVER
ncbi:MAG: SUMF1/EgtB/PvdO family nonheme iron enzyme, partial [Planctomycetes bacterium]|nr:SUMF1/EgtB/PvdO family nonheme iron enzyme [Planctomycetota bacterium]